MPAVVFVPDERLALIAYVGEGSHIHGGIGEAEDLRADEVGDGLVADGRLESVRRDDGNLLDDVEIQMLPLHLLAGDEIENERIQIGQQQRGKTAVGGFAVRAIQVAIRAKCCQTRSSPRSSRSHGAHVGRRGHVLERQRPFDARRRFDLLPVDPKLRLRQPVHILMLLQARRLWLRRPMQLAGLTTMLAAR
ncbi:MAG: hypothetical protein U1F42_01070 [Candidatus Competibacteraceae bacterium]